MLSKKRNDADVCGYCDLRFPVADLKRSVDFYCNVLGYELANPENPGYQHSEVFVTLKNGNGPGIFLMEVGPEEVKQLRFHWSSPSWIRSSENHVMVVEMMTNDLYALHERIKQSGLGARIEKEPVFTEEFGYFTFYDPDGHYIQAVEERGAYFFLNQRICTTLGRQLTEHENQLLWGLCDRASVEQQKFLASLISELVAGGKN